MIKDLLKRSSWHTLGLFAGKLLSTVTFVVLARLLSPALFGQILLLVTFVTLSNTLGSFGLNQWYQKQKASVSALFKSGGLFQQVFEARLLTLVLSMLIIGVWTVLTRSFPPSLTFILLISLVPEALVSIIDGYYLSAKKPLYLVIMSPIKMILILTGVFGFGVATLESLFSLYALGAGVAVLCLFPWREIKLHFSFSQSIKTLKASSQYALLITTSYAYARGDQLIIRYAVSEAALGIYGAAYRYLESLSLLPSAISQNLFHLSAQKGSLKLNQIVKLILVMAVLGALTAVALFLSADFLTTFLLGPDYQAAAQLVRIFSIVVVLFFVNAPLSTLVQSSDLLKKFLPWGITNTAINIVLNLFLVPIWGIVAASWIMVATEVSGLLLNTFFVYLLYKNK